MQNIEMLDIVALVEDLPEQELFRGQVGTVVEIHTTPGYFEVEFSGKDGIPYAMLALHESQLLKLIHEPLTDRREWGN
jgi:hypothetical protein